LGRHFDESTLIQVAHAFERHTDFHKAKPRL
ncbi:MAG: glutamyl-tRNA(Gln) amidotransferase, A subunit, partial [Desulfobacca sp. 4484_104]